MDGFAQVWEYAERQKQINQKFLCITDHGVMGAVPQQISESEKHGLFPLFGAELYVNPMQPKVANRNESADFRRSLGDGSGDATPEQKKFDKSAHLLAIAYNNIGYSNLVRLTSWAWIHGYYKKPRVNHEVLQQYKEGIIFTSTCANSEIAKAFFEGGDEAGFAMVEKYMAMFGDKFYLELMMLDFKDQKPYDAFLLRAHLKYGVPIILTQDCFVSGTLVLTSNGHKPIESIQVGDMVLTHENRFRRVEAVGQRPLKSQEKVYRVKTRVGSYAFDATGDHKIRVANKTGRVWKFDWKKTKDLAPKEDFLLVPKIPSDGVFAPTGPETIDLMDFIKEGEYWHIDDCRPSAEGNMSTRLGYDPEKEEFVSCQRFCQEHKTRIPRFLPVDDDFLKVVGWYIAEGWSEKKNHQVGFALHIDEQDVADWIIKYFSQFGITAKTYKVSDNGIAVRFSSIVFKRLLGRMCGFGAGNKHIPYICGRWMGVWDKSQIGRILSCFWQGDGSGSKGRLSGFRSTSKGCIYEIATVFNALGMPSLPSVDRPQKRGKKWSDCWSLYFSADRSELLHEFFDGKEVDFRPSPFWRDLGSCWAIRIVSVRSVSYAGPVYDMRVAEDHSYTASFHTVSNCHVCLKEHSHNQHLMLMQKSGTTLAEIQYKIDAGLIEDVFEMQDRQLYLKSESDLDEYWETTEYKNIIDYELYKQAKANTVKIAEFAKGVQIDREIKLPKFPDAEETLWDEIKKGFILRGCPKEDRYFKRIREEYDLIVEKGFASYFLIQKMMTDEARRIGPEILGFGDGSEAVGSGRGCLHPDNPIRTYDGRTVKIGEVREGECVLTRDGTFQVVEKVMRYDLGSEKLLKISSYYGDHFGVVLTKDHEILSEKQVRPEGWGSWSESTKRARKTFVDPKGDLDWRRADELSVGDWCFLPIPVIAEIPPIEIDLGQFCGGFLPNGKRTYFHDKWVFHEFNSKKGGRTVRIHDRFWKLDKEWACILGVFAGDGWTRSGNFDQVGFCDNATDRSHIDFVSEFFERHGCDTTTVERQNGKDATQLIVKSFYMKRLFENLHPNYNHTPSTKHVPLCVLHGPIELVEAYIHGYFLADGHEDDSKVKFETVSLTLAEQVRFLLLRMGIPSSLAIDNRVDERPEYSNRRTSYVVTCPLDKRIGCRRDSCQKYNWKPVPGGILLRIRSIKEIEGPAEVCDLQVVNNHNYTTGSFLVHNSVCGSLVAYVLRLHDVEPIIHDLRFSRFLSPARGGKQMKIRHTLEPIPHERIIA